MRTRVKALLTAAVVLLGVRAALPFVVKSRLNAKLARVEGWEARVGDVDLALLRGGLVLRGLSARSRKADVEASVARTAINVSWSALLRRRFVASVDISRPKATLALEKAAKKETKKAAKKAEKKAELAWPDVRDLVPFRIDRLEIHDGAVTVKEGEQTASITGLYFVVKGLTNLRKGARAKGEAGARVMKEGTVRVDFEVDPVSSPPEFSFALAVKKVDLAALNPVLRSEFGMDVDKGVFELVSEATSTGGGFHGYVKPFVEGLKMGPTGGKKKSAVKVVEEAVVGAVAAVLKNKKTEAVAAKVPFEGKYDDPDIGVWRALLSVLHNAFVKALTPTFE